MKKPFQYSEVDSSGRPVPISNASSIGGVFCVETAAAFAMQTFLIISIETQCQCR